MGLILDLAVIAIAAVVVGSLALLTWTLGVSSVRSVRNGRRDVARARRLVADAEVRIAALGRAATRPAPEPGGTRTNEPGDGTEA